MRKWIKYKKRTLLRFISSRKNIDVKIIVLYYFTFNKDIIVWEVICKDFLYKLLKRYISDNRNRHKL